MVTLNLRLDDELDRRLAQETEFAEETRSELARRAIMEFLERRQRQRFLDQIARAARERGSGEAIAVAEEALITDNEALALVERRGGKPKARYRAKRKKR